MKMSNNYYDDMKIYNNVFNADDKFDILTTFIEYNKDLYSSKDSYTSVMKQISSNYNGISYKGGQILNENMVHTYIFNGANNTKLFLYNMKKLHIEIVNGEEYVTYNFNNYPTVYIFDLLPIKLSINDIKRILNNKSLVGLFKNSDYLIKFYKLVCIIVEIPMEFVEKAYLDISFNFNS